MDGVVKYLEIALRKVAGLKTAERNEEQRLIAILATDLEKVLVWAKHCDSKNEDI